MSLSVKLYGKTKIIKCVCNECYNEHSREETECLFYANITHNLGKMAERASIYKEVWRPDEIGIKKAGELVTIIIISVQVYYQKVNSKIAEMVANGSDPFIAALSLDNLTDDAVKTYYLDNKHIDTTTKSDTMKQI